MGFIHEMIDNSISKRANYPTDVPAVLKPTTVELLGARVSGILKGQADARFGEAVKVDLIHDRNAVCFVEKRLAYLQAYDATLEDLAVPEV